MGGHRSTYTLDADQVQNLFRAFRFAETLGLDLQTPATIAWSHTRVKPDDIPRGFVAYKERASKWLGRRDVPWTGIFVHENGAVFGLHSHLLIHVPEHLQDPFAAMSQHWANAKRKSATQLRPSSGNGPLGWLHYMAKGINPTDHDCRIVAEQFRINPSENGRGWVSFKRSGTTENIGWAARAKHDFCNLSKAA